MKITIQHRFNLSVLFKCEAISIREGVELAVRTKANLSSADLRWADLHSANLSSADLRWADLRWANGVNRYRTSPLYMMRDQVGVIRAYKIVNKKNEGIYNGGLVYNVGDSLEVKNANTNEEEDCGCGINLATLDWCMSVYEPGYKILICEFDAKDIAAIPVGTDGKFRVHRCRVVGEKDLSEVGLVVKAEASG